MKSGSHSTQASGRRIPRRRRVRALTITCRPSRRDREYAARDDGVHGHKLWDTAPPFNANPRGILAHRIKTVTTHFRNGEFSHLSVDYWCNNCTCGVCLVEDPGDRLLCSRCEGLAVAAGEQPASALGGRHIHVGELRAVRLCCRNDHN